MGPTASHSEDGPVSGRLRRSQVDRVFQAEGVTPSTVGVGECKPSFVQERPLSSVYAAAGVAAISQLQEFAEVHFFTTTTTPSGGGGTDTDTDIVPIELEPEPEPKEAEERSGTGTDTDIEEWTSLSEVVAVPQDDIVPGVIVPTIKFDDLEFSTVLGIGNGDSGSVVDMGIGVVVDGSSGSSGDDGSAPWWIFKVLWKGQVSCLKLLKMDVDLESEVKLDEFKKEVEKFSLLRHPNIVALKGVLLHPPRIALLHEFCPYDNLERFLKSYPCVSFELRIRFLLEIASAMKFMHSEKILNRRLEPKNVLVSAKWHTRLVDFGMLQFSGSPNPDSGLSRVVEQMTGSSPPRTRRSSMYLAPEILSDETSGDFGSDIFSFGFLVYVVLSGRWHPFGERTSQIQLKVATDPNMRPPIDKLFAEIRYQKPSPDLCHEISYLLPRLWSHDVRERPSFVKIYDSFTRLPHACLGLEIPSHRPEPMDLPKQETDPKEEKSIVPRKIFVRSEDMCDLDAEAVVIPELSLDALHRAVAKWGGRPVEEIRFVRRVVDGIHLKVSRDETVERFPEASLIVVVWVD